jgi:sigma-B regulation protein RsbU (phosphoserine phosphatase)
MTTPTTHFDIGRLSDDELRRCFAGMNRLLEVTRKLAAEIDLAAILTAIVNEACQALDCDRASLYQYDRKRNELYTTVVTELEIEEIRKSLDFGISGHVARTRELANVADPQSHPQWDSSVDRATGYQTRNILSVPLTSPHDDSLLGVLSVLNRHQGSFDGVDEMLIAAFSQHAAVALDRARLVEEIKSREQIEASLQVARAVQRSFMPDATPDIPGYEAATWWYPHEAVGGDYCDIVRMRDGRCGLCVADVSGHGLGPSLLMASVRAALRALLLEHSSADVLLQMLARALADDLHGPFITMVLVALDPKTHRAEFANAGHAPAMHYSAANSQFHELDSTGVPLGVVEDAEYPLGPPIDMQPGDLIFLCTDGIVEAMDAGGEHFGQQRLESLIRRHAAAPVSELVLAIGREVAAFYVGEHPPDDLTILAARRND